MYGLSYLLIMVNSLQARADADCVPSPATTFEALAKASEAASDHARRKRGEEARACHRAAAQNSLKAIGLPGTPVQDVRFQIECAFAAYYDLAEIQPIDPRDSLDALVVSSEIRSQIDAKAPGYQNFVVDNVRKVRQDYENALIRLEPEALAASLERLDWFTTGTLPSVFSPEIVERVRDVYHAWLLKRLDSLETSPRNSAIAFLSAAHRAYPKIQQIDKSLNTTIESLLVADMLRLRWPGTPLPGAVTAVEAESVRSAMLLELYRRAKKAQRPMLDVDALPILTKAFAAYRRMFVSEKSVRFLNEVLGLCYDLLDRLRGGALTDVTVGEVEAFRDALAGAMRAKARNARGDEAKIISWWAYSAQRRAPIANMAEMTAQCYSVTEWYQAGETHPYLPGATGAIAHYAECGDLRRRLDRAAATTGRKPAETLRELARSYRFYARLSTRPELYRKPDPDNLERRDVDMAMDGYRLGDTLREVMRKHPDALREFNRGRPEGEYLDEAVVWRMQKGLRYQLRECLMKDAADTSQAAQTCVDRADLENVHWFYMSLPDDADPVPLANWRRICRALQDGGEVDEHAAAQCVTFNKRRRRLLTTGATLTAIGGASLVGFAVGLGLGARAQDRLETVAEDERDPLFDQGYRANVAAAVLGSVGPLVTIIGAGVLVRSRGSVSRTEFVLRPTFGPRTTGVQFFMSF